MNRLYEFLLKIISLLTGLDRSVILRAFEVYTASDIDYYDTKAGVVWVVNLPKHPLGERLNSTLQTHIASDIHYAPYCELKKRFMERQRWRRMGHACPIDGVNSISTQSQSPPPLNLNFNLTLWRRGCRGKGNRTFRRLGRLKSPAGAESPGPPAEIAPDGVEPPGPQPGITPAGVEFPGPPAEKDANVFRVYQPNSRAPTAIAEALRDAESSDGVEWLCAAVAAALKKDLSTWRSCQAIPMRLRRDGSRSATRLAEAGLQEESLPLSGCVLHPGRGWGVGFRLSQILPFKLGRGRERGIRFLFDTRNESRITNTEYPIPFP